MKQGAFLVNTSNASLVDDIALAGALKSGQLKGAALDVFQIESFHPVNGPLKDAPNLIITPHSSFYSDVSSREMREMAAQEVRRGLQSKHPFTLRNCVNRELLGNISAASILSSSQTNANGSSNMLSNVNSLNAINNRNLTSGSPAAVAINQITPPSQPSAGGNPLSTASLLSNTASSNSNPNAQLLAHLSCKFFAWLNFGF